MRGVFSNCCDVTKLSPNPGQLAVNVHGDIFKLSRCLIKRGARGGRVLNQHARARMGVHGVLRLKVRRNSADKIDHDRIAMRGG